MSRAKLRGCQARVSTVGPSPVQLEVRVGKQVVIGTENRVWRARTDPLSIGSSYVLSGR
jgi:hypothetical protein